LSILYIQVVLPCNYDIMIILDYYRNLRQIFVFGIIAKLCLYDNWRMETIN